MKNKIIIVSLVLIVSCLLIFIGNNKNNDNDKNKDDNLIQTKEENKTILIDESGEYNLTGKITGNVLVKTDGKVKLILDNVYIKSLNGPAILIENAEEV